MIATFAFVVVAVVSIALLAPQIVRGLRGRDPFRPLENGRKSK